MATDLGVWSGAVAEVPRQVTSRLVEAQPRVEGHWLEVQGTWPHGQDVGLGQAALTLAKAASASL